MHDWEGLIRGRDEGDIGVDLLLGVEIDSVVTGTSDFWPLCHAKATRVM
jgi:hypothetical protein